LVEIAPFRGLMYSKAEIEDHGGLLVAPPYDVLNESEQKKCLDLHPHNILHLDYNFSRPEDPDKWTWHERSAEILKQWLSEGVLTRLDKPVIFQIETTCRNPDRSGNIVRHGFVCLMKLEEFSPESQVRPHEKTFSSHKEERLDLMKRTSATLSQVFGFFPDEDRRALNQMTASTFGRTPGVDIKDFRGFGHRMWLTEDEREIKGLVEALKDRRVYIADGHHRYETALNYRRWRQEEGQAPGSSDYIMIYLCPMSDPGLVIYPTHRLLKNLNLHPDEIINRLSRYFKISGKTFSPETEPARRDRFLTKMKKQKNCLGLYMAGRKAYYVLSLLESAFQDPALAGEARELAMMDTVVLSNIVFKEALGLTESDLDNPDIISYVSSLPKALEMIDKNEQEAAFILNPATVEDILRVTEKGLIMPRKSTFFYPKVTTGLVLNLID